MNENERSYEVSCFVSVLNVQTPFQAVIMGISCLGSNGVCYFSLTGYIRFEKIKVLNL